MSNPVGSLLVRIGADTGGMRKGGRESEGIMASMSRQAQDTTKRLAQIATAAAAAGAALTIALTKKGLESVDAQAKLARQVGGTADAIRGLRIAASDAGVESSVMDKAVEKLNQRIGEARRGTGMAAASFARLGIDAENLARMDVDQRMAHIADRMKDLGMSTDQAADELLQMGIRNAELVNLMIDGGDAIRSARREVDDYGLSLSAVDTAQVEAANDAMSRIKLVVEAVSNQLAVQLSPILQGVANLFTDTAKEAGGVGEAVGKGVNMGVRAVGFLADSVESVRRIFLLAGQGVATFASWLIGDMAKSARAIIEGPIRAVNLLISQINRLPGINISEIEMPDIVGRLQAEIESSKAAVQAGREAMAETLAAPMPSEGIKQWVSEQRAASLEAAEAAVAAEADRNERILAMKGEHVEEVNALDEKAAAQEQARREQNFERLVQSMMDKREAEVAGHEERMEWLIEAFEAELLAEEEFKARKEELEAAHQDRLSKIEYDGLTAREKFERASMRKRVSIVAGELANMTAAAAGENRKMFELNKAAAIANAIINTFQGISMSLGAYPMPLAAIMAAVHGAAGIATVNSIRSQSFGGGGGGAPSNLGTTPVTPQAGAGAGPEGGTMTVQGLSPGSLFTGAVVAELAEELLDYQKRGGNVAFAS